MHLWETVSGPWPTKIVTAEVARGTCPTEVVTSPPLGEGRHDLSDCQDQDSEIILRMNTNGMVMPRVTVEARAFLMADL